MGIFDKMAIPYDTLRLLENPVAPVANYYKSQLKKGESLWWTSDNLSEEVAPPKVRHWKVIDKDEKAMLLAQAYVLFPEIILGSPRDKYDRFALWLATKHGVINTSLRDDFSAGGQQKIIMQDGSSYMISAVIKRMENSIKAIKIFLLEIPEDMLSIFWDCRISRDRVSQWKTLVLSYGARKLDFSKVSNILTAIINEQTIYDDLERVTALAEQAGQYLAYQHVRLKMNK